ncbi:MAG: YXWGXW repeat-containing protein [Deltaproteobacteria bacterium]|nr:YXWGXW repeat-containing protein [Deltaproteobacteria bacterium]
MKKILAIIVAAGLLAALLPAPASAGDREWATAGKILTGIIGLNILGHAIAHPYPYPAPMYSPPPRVYYPPEQVWVPGHYETRFQRQWIPGHWEIQRYGGDRDGDDDDDDDDDYDDGYRARRVWVPGHYRNVEVRVWIPGYWEG